jgi:uncharacterized membrane protein
MVNVKCLLLLLTAFASFSVQAKEFWQDVYFWRQKPALLEKMQNERYMPVSVQRFDRVWSMKGAGRVSAPGEFVYRFARQFERLEKLPEHFKKVQWSEEKKQLKLQVSVLGKSLDFTYQMTEEVSQGLKRRMIWQMIEGIYKGSQTALLVEDTGGQECEVVLISSYLGKAWILLIK